MRGPIFRLAMIIGVVLGTAGSVGAQSDAALNRSKRKTAEQLVSVQATADTKRIAPGQEFMLAFVFDIEPKWHIYWVNPGASGAATHIEVTAPGGYQIGETRFPRPQAIGSWDGPKGLTYGYEQQAILFVPVKAPPRITPGEASFTADIIFLVCKGVCMMGTVQRTAVIATTDDPYGASSGIDPVLDAARARLPRPLDDLDGATVQFRGTILTITAPADDFDTATLFPIDMPGVTFGEPKIVVHDGRITATVSVEVRPRNAKGERLRLTGVLGLGETRNDPSYVFELPLSSS